MDTTSSLRWLYIDFNSYFASVEQQLDPRLRNRPVIVIPVETDATCAIAASYEAKACGIKTGTPVWEAKRLCPEIICVLAKHDQYVIYHHRILEEVNNHIPITAVCSIDEVACRLMDNEIDPKRATEIALSVKAGLSKNIGEHIRCSIGIAPNRYLAKIATDLKKPDGLTFIHKHDLPGKLLPLALRDLPGIGHNMEVRLFKAGIGSMQQLWALDPKHMRKVWGSIWGEKIWYLLRGVEIEEEETKKTTIGHSHVLAPELRTPNKAKLVARRLTLKVTSRLRRLNYYAGLFYISIRLEDDQKFKLVKKCYRAQDSLTFLKLLDEAWQEFIPMIGRQRVKKISVSLYELTLVNELQQDLFPQLPKAELDRRFSAEKLSKALDKINHRFGRDSILVGMLPSEGKSFSGTKIAFTRIPEIEEFLE